MHELDFIPTYVAEWKAEKRRRRRAALLDAAAWIAWGAGVMLLALVGWSEW